MTELVRGSVADRPWGRTFAALGLRAVTGQLTLFSEGKRFVVAFEHGAVVAALSPLAADAAVRVALTTHLISSSQVPEISRRQAAAPDRDEIEVIAELARLGPEHARRLRRRAIAQRAARTFSINQGEFVVTDGIELPIIDGCELDVRAVIYIGARANLSEPRLAGDLEQLGAWFRLKPGCDDELPQFGFTDVEQPIVERLRDGGTLEELESFAASFVDGRTVRAVVYALASYNACDIELVPPPGSVRTRSARPSQSAILGPGPGPGGRPVETQPLPRASGSSPPPPHARPGSQPLPRAAGPDEEARATRQTPSPPVQRPTIPPDPGSRSSQAQTARLPPTQAGPRPPSTAMGTGAMRGVPVDDGAPRSDPALRLPADTQRVRSDPALRLPPNFTMERDSSEPPLRARRESSGADPLRPRRDTPTGSEPVRDRRETPSGTDPLRDRRDDSSLDALARVRRDTPTGSEPVRGRRDTPTGSEGTRERREGSSVDALGRARRDSSPGSEGLRREGSSVDALGRARRDSSSGFGSGSDAPRDPRDIPVDPEAGRERRGTPPGSDPLARTRDTPFGSGPQGRDTPPRGVDPRRAMRADGSDPALRRPPAEPEVTPTVLRRRIPTSRPPAAREVAKTDTARSHEVKVLIAQRLKLLDQGADHFQLLGIAQDAAPESVRKAYFDLARQLHPDRLAALGIPDDGKHAQRLFAEINAGFAILSDRSRRAEYVDVLRKGGEAAVRAEQAKAEQLARQILEGEEAFRRAEMALRRDQPQAAVSELERAVQLAPDEADYHALLAWARFAAAADKPVVAALTRKALEQAIERAPKAVTARFYLGRVERMLGRDSEALRHFREVLATSPGHSEAAAELRVLESKLASGKPRR